MTEHTGPLRGEAMSSADPMIGKTLGDYTIDGVLGTGGMARVYRGYDRKLARYAAVKVIEPRLIASAEQEEYRQRFLREARAIARLNHQRIVGVYQFGQYQNLYYIAMAYVEGRNLREIMQTNAEADALTPTHMVRILRDIADALDYAHQQGIIHRDVKPSNIIVNKEGQAILTDFGLALNATEGTIGNTFGSVHYIAPEQAISSAQAVPQSDQYSLSVIAYEMLSGRVPFDDASAMSVALKHISEVPPSLSVVNPKISSRVERVVMRALDKSVQRRFITCLDFVQELQFAFDTESDWVLPSRQRPPANLRKFSAASLEAASLEQDDAWPDTAPQPGIDTKADGVHTLHDVPQLAPVPSKLKARPAPGTSQRASEPSRDASASRRASEPFMRTPVSLPKMAVEDSRPTGLRRPVPLYVSLLMALIVALGLGAVILAVVASNNTRSSAISAVSSPTPTPTEPAPTSEPTSLPDTPAPDTPAPDTPAPDTPAPVESTPNSAQGFLAAVYTAQTQIATTRLAATLTEEAETEAEEAEDEAATPQSTVTRTATPRPPTTATERRPSSRASATPGFAMTDADDAEVLLRYDGRTLVLYNRAESDIVEVRNLRFLLFEPQIQPSASSGTSAEEIEIVQTKSYRASEWGELWRGLQPESCLQVWTLRYVTLPGDEPPADMCNSRMYYRQTARPFWISSASDSGAYFEVRLGRVDVVATCPVVQPDTFSEVRCAVDLP